MHQALRNLFLAAAVSALAAGCARGHGPAAAAAQAQAQAQAQPGDAAFAAGTGRTAASTGQTAAGNWVGFDRNDYPGDATMAAMQRTFAFTGYWITNPPGGNSNSWVGKRMLLRQQGWGFLVLANGKLDADILKAAKAGTPAAELGRKDAAVAVSSAQQEGFPAHTVLFLDQEEGGRLLAEQAAYLLGWTEAVAASDFRPGVYASGEPVEDGPGATIDTVEDIRSRVTAGKLHEVAIFDAQDACPPAPGCNVQAKTISAAGEPGVVAWQFAQSPRRPEFTKSCGKTYAADGNCYAPGFSQVFLDLNVARSADPSGGR